MSRGLALFDFDGTITSGDTLFHFLRHALPGPRFALGAVLLLPVLAGYKLGLIGNARAKSIMLRHFFGGWPEERFRAAGAAFAREMLPLLIRPAALERIREHMVNGDRVLVVSASLSDWVGGWCADQGLELLATEAEVRDGRITGRFATRQLPRPGKGAPHPGRAGPGGLRPDPRLWGLLGRPRDARPGPRTPLQALPRRRNQGKSRRGNLPGLLAFPMSFFVLRQPSLRLSLTP
jgi:Phosphoserine phosphatase